MQAMRRVGFTLIEVLVVIGIVALLAGLLFPVLRSVREQARATVCQSHIREISLILCQYETDNGTFPYAYRSKAIRNLKIIANYLDPAGLWWIDLIGQDLIPEPYVLHTSILECPSKRYQTTEFKYNLYWGNYGVNWSILRSPTAAVAFWEYRGTPLSLGRIRYPSQTLLIADSGYALLGWSHTLAQDGPPLDADGFDVFDHSYIPGASVNPRRDLWPAQEADALEGRHPGGTVNVGYVDGHVERRKADDLLVTEAANGEMTNVSPLWKPKGQRAYVNPTLSN